LQGPVRHITLNKPEKRNAMNRATSAAFETGPAPQDLPAAFDAGVSGRPDQRVSWVTKSARVDATFAELDASVQRVATTLIALGLEPGSVVVTQLPNRREGLVLIHAALRAGLVIAPMLPTQGPRELQAAMAATRARVYVATDIADRALWHSSLAQYGPVDPATHLIAADRTGSGVMRWLEAEAGNIDRADSGADVDPAAAAAVLFTSGSTGKAKAVVHTHRGLLACAAVGIPGAEDGDHVELSILPSGHVGGVIRAVRTFVLGTRAVYLDGWDVDRALDLIRDEGITTTSVTPYFLSQLIQRQRERPRDTSSLQHVMVGGANVPTACVEAADALGWRTTKAYGSTEHPNSFGSHVSDPLSVRASSSGRAAPGVRARILRSDGADAPPGDEGELVVQGPAQFAGYLDAADTGASFTGDGWFRTGDLGRIDGAGLLTITGRIKDIVIRGGENISAAEVENLLMTDERVLEAAVVGYPDKIYGERVCAFLVLKDGSTMGLGEVRAHFQDSGIDRRKTPERVVVVDQLPRIGPGKVAKDRLRSMAADPALEAGDKQKQDKQKQEDTA